jgi:hypothetical protein
LRELIHSTPWDVLILAALLFSGTFYAAWFMAEEVWEEFLRRKTSRK